MNNQSKILRLTFSENKSLSRQVEFDVEDFKFENSEKKQFYVTKRSNLSNRKSVKNNVKEHHFKINVLFAANLKKRLVFENPIFIR